MENINNLRKIESVINKDLFIICSIITLVTMVLVTTDFLTRGRFLPSKINFFYLAVVIIYSLHKELIRWLGEKNAKRQGEYFVYIWILLTTALYAINFVSRDYYNYSAEGYQVGTLRDIAILTIEVLIVFIFTRFLKLLEILVKSKK